MRKKKSENLKDPSPDKYTPTEILGQVALGNMDPKEAGVTQPIPLVGEGRSVDPSELDKRDVPIIGQPKVLPAAIPQRVFGGKLEFQASVVPIELRAEWARQESKIVPFDVADWIEDNKNTFRVQGLLACGNAVLRLDQIYTDPILGLCELMREGADKLEAEHQRIINSTNESTKQEDTGPALLHSDPK